MNSKLREAILKYISVEKDISRHYISRLEKRESLESSKRRILEIEKEFVSLPLENMYFEDVADVAAAISIYRSSRSLFHKTYDTNALLDEERKVLLKKINKKISFLENTAVELMSIRIREINVVQSEDFFDELSEYVSKKTGKKIRTIKRELEKKNIKELLEIEPIKLAKKRARLQAALYSLGLYIAEHVRACEFNDNSSIEELEDVRRILDFIVADAKNNIFKHYNVALKKLPNETRDTMGENKYLAKIHDLVNVLNFDHLIKDASSLPRPLGVHNSYSIDSPNISNLFNNQKDSEKSMVFGILLPIPRKGNEKMTLLYKSISAKDCSLDFISNDYISNVKVEDSDGNIEYYKAILLAPLSELKSAVGHLENGGIKDFIDNISKLGNQSISINSKANIALVPKTRSEEAGIAEISTILKGKIFEIKEGYFKD
jgi:hypothetical protein